MNHYTANSAMQLAREMEEEEKQKQEELRKESEKRQLELAKITAQNKTIALLEKQLAETKAAQEEAKREAENPGGKAIFRLLWL